MKIFRPEEILDKYQDFDVKKYIEQGNNTIFMDIDNTLAPYYEELPDQNAIEFVNRLKSAGFNIFIVSNNTEERVAKFANALNLPYSYWSFKPLWFIYYKLIRDNNLDKNKIICVGDQLLTDVLGANLSGLKGIYVKPLVDKDSIQTKINRTIERLIFKYLL